MQFACRHVRADVHAMYYMYAMHRTYATHCACAMHCTHDMHYTYAMHCTYDMHWQPSQPSGSSQVAGTHHRVQCMAWHSIAFRVFGTHHHYLITTCMVHDIMASCMAAHVMHDCSPRHSCSALLLHTTTCIIHSPTMVFLCRGSNEITFDNFRHTIGRLLNAELTWRP